MRYAHPACARNVRFQCTTSATTASIVQAPRAKAKAPKATDLCDQNLLYAITICLLPWQKFPHAHDTMTCAQIAPSSSLNSNDTCPLKDVDLVPQNLVREVRAVNAQNLTYIGVVPFSGSYRMSDGVDCLIHGRRYREETYREEQVCMFGRAFGACDHLQGPLLLGNDGGCHNLWFIDDDICQTQLAGRVPPRNFVAYAVGGQHKATRWASDGIYLFGIEARGSWPFEFRAYRCKFLVNGNHAGSMEKRKHKGNVSEFDGQSF